MKSPLARAQRLTRQESVRRRVVSAHVSIAEDAMVDRLCAEFDVSRAVLLRILLHVAHDALEKLDEETG